MSDTRKSSDLVTVLPASQALANLLEIDKGDPFNLQENFYQPLVKEIPAGKQRADMVAIRFINVTEQYLDRLEKSSRDSEIGSAMEVAIAREGIEDDLTPYVIQAMIPDPDDAGLVLYNIKNLRRVRAIMAHERDKSKPS